MVRCAKIGRVVYIHVWETGMVIVGERGILYEGRGEGKAGLGTG